MDAIYPFFFRDIYAALSNTRVPKIMRPSLLINLCEMALAAYVLCRSAVLAKLEHLRGRFDVDVFVHFFEVLLPLVVLGQSAAVRHDYGDKPGERYIAYLRQLCVIFTVSRRHNYKLSTLTKLAWFSCVRSNTHTCAHAHTRCLPSVTLSFYTPFAGIWRSRTRLCMSG
jgi:hypothetical protein